MDANTAAQILGSKLGYQVIACAGIIPARHMGSLY